jgi:hypothetical protein
LSRNRQFWVVPSGLLDQLNPRCSINMPVLKSSASGALLVTAHSFH